MEYKDYRVSRKEIKELFGLKGARLNQIIAGFHKAKSDQRTYLYFLSDVEEAHKHWVGIDAFNNWSKDTLKRYIERYPLFHDQNLFFARSITRNPQFDLYEQARISMNLAIIERINDEVTIMNQRPTTQLSLLDTLGISTVDEDYFSTNLDNTPYVIIP